MVRDVQVQKQMFALINDWLKSGQSQLEYCKTHDIRYHAFHYWYKKFNRSLESSKPEPGFTLLQVAEHKVAYAEVCFVNGTCIKFHQPVSADYLKALAG